MDTPQVAYLKRCVQGNASGLYAVLAEGRDIIQAEILRRAGLAPGALSGKKFDALAATITGHYATLNRDIASYFKTICATQGREWLKFAFDDSRFSFTPGELQKFSMEYTGRFFAYNVKPYIAAHVQNMSATEVDQLRKAVTDSLRVGSITGATAKETSKTMQERFMALAGKDSATWSFMDRAGKSWTARNYFNTLSRTVTANIARTAYMDGLAKTGFDLVRISNKGDACPICRQWADRIISQSGKYPGVPSYEQAVAAGVFHPNCVCTLEFVSPALEAADIEKQSGKPYVEPEQPAPKLVPLSDTGFNRTPEAAPLLPVKAFPAGVDALAALKQVKALGGSTGATLVEDKAGQRFVLKRGASPEHVRSEFAADEVYRIFGANVPEGRLYETPDGPVKLTRYIEDAKPLSALKGGALDDARFKMGEHFHVDAALGNWDVLGADRDNILVDKAGAVWRIDNGGALSFRAQGVKKTADEWGQYPTELFTMRAAGATQAETFSWTGIYDISRAIERDFTPAKVAELVKNTALSPEARAVLIARMEEAKTLAVQMLDHDAVGWLQPHAEGVGKHIMGLRKAGFTDALPKNLYQGPSKTAMVDDSGRAFGGLRGGSANAPKGAAADQYDFISPIKAAAKTINHHVNLGDTNFNEATINAALKAMSSADHAFSVGKITKGYHAHVVQSFEGMVNAKNATLKGTPTKAPIVADFTGGKYPAASTAKASGRTDPRKILGEYMDGQNIPQWIYTQFMQGHAGVSGHPDAINFRYLVAASRRAGADEYSWHFADALKKNNPAKALAHHADIYRDFISSKGMTDELVKSSWQAWSAAHQEMLRVTSFPGNDTKARAVRIMRTENIQHMNAQKLKPGEVQMLRGPNDSGSVFTTVNIKGNQLTDQAVPHPDITGSYFFSKGDDDGPLFHSNGENEFTFIGSRTPARYIGQTADRVDRTTTGNVKDWNVPTHHLPSERRKSI